MVFVAMLVPGLALRAISANVLLGPDGTYALEPDFEGSASTDFIVGALFLGGGAALTYLSMTGGGIGGRAVLAWGPMLYGIDRIVRGFTR